MGVLQVAVLGRPEIVHAGVRVALSSSKAAALVSYLAVTRQAHPRSALSGMLWGELPDDRARANLRLVLSGLRRVLPGHLVISGRDIGPGPGWVVDLDECSDALAGDDAKLACQWVRHDLLAGLVVDGAPGFEEWLLAERARVRRSAVDGLTGMARRLAGHEPDAALALARELVALDPLDEAGHRLVIELLAATGRRAAGLAQYETCRHVLADELGVDPSPETVALRDRILRDDPIGRHGRDPAADAASAARGTRRDGRSRPAAAASPLIGREDERRQIEALLTDDACRLVTLVGPGGVGKTRLALAAVEVLDKVFADGVAFVSLAPVPAGASPMEVAGALATSLDVPRWKDSPEAALRRTLAGRRLLMVLDSVEHLKVAGLLAELLDALPDLTVLATSRQRIGLGAEWLIDVGGLPYPLTVTADIGRYPAVQLFAERARHVRSTFTVADDPAAVLRICRLVEGLPLALELAADWMRSLRTDQVAQVIESDIDALATEHHVVEERQRSMRSVLESSWQLLDDSQQRVLARLSVFSGEFDADAAEAVAGASATDLGRLTDRSMVQRHEDGRFDLHELLRQFALERLAADADDAAATRRLHAHHYAAIADAHADAASAGDLVVDLANLRSAAAWLIDHGDEDTLASLVASLWHIDEAGTRYPDAITLLDAALERPAVSAPRAAVWHRWAGTAAMELGDMHRAAASFDAAIAVSGRPFPRTRVARFVTMCRTLGSIVTRRIGLHRRRDRPYVAERVLALQLLGRTMYFLQQPPSLVLTTLLAVDEAERADDATVMTVAFAELAHMCAVGGLRGAARRYGRRFDGQVPDRPRTELELLGLESRALTQIAVGEWDGAAMSITRALDGANRLGHESARLEVIATSTLLPLFQGQFTDARDRFEEALAQARRLGDAYGFLWSAAGVAEARLWLGTDPGTLIALQTEAVDRSEGLPAPERMKGRAVLATLMLAAGRSDEALMWVRVATAAAREARLLPVWALDGYGHCAQSWLALWDLTGEPSPEVRRGAKYTCGQLRRYARSYPIGAARYHWAAGWLAWLNGRPHRARAAWRRSLAAAEHMRMQFDEARAHAALVLAVDDVDDRQRHRERAVVIADEAGFAADRLGLRPTDALLTLF